MVDKMDEDKEIKVIDNSKLINSIILIWNLEGYIQWSKGE